MPAKTKEQRSAINKAYRERHKERLKCLNAARRKAHPEIYLDRHLRNRYDISLDDYNILLEFQNGLCAICQKPPIKGRLAVDHNHKNGHVRGLVHRRCNTAIGLFEDNPYLLQRAAEYLQKGLLDFLKPHLNPENVLFKP